MDQEQIQAVLRERLRRDEVLKGRIETAARAGAGAALRELIRRVLEPLVTGVVDLTASLLDRITAWFDDF